MKTIGHVYGCMVRCITPEDITKSAELQALHFSHLKETVKAIILFVGLGKKEINNDNYDNNNEPMTCMRLFLHYLCVWKRKELAIAWIASFIHKCI